MLSNRDKKSSIRDRAMSDVAFAKNLFREAFSERRYGSVKAAIYAAHRFLSRKVVKQFTERRARSIWEGTARRIDSEEMDALRQAVIEESKREQVELRSRLAALDALLAAQDAASFREAMDGGGLSTGRVG